ncbi:hypothetical protein FHS93_001508 [Sphingobium francense]|nr:hypothetical protein [Sphingobium indicum]
MMMISERLAVNDTILSDAVAATAFRRLVAHLQHRTDVQNIDLMGLAGFCRNCLADWIAEADGAMSKDEAREIIHGMPFAEWKARHQGEATPEQIARMQESVAKNADSH